MGPHQMGQRQLYEISYKMTSGKISEKKLCMDQTFKLTITKHEEGGHAVKYLKYEGVSPLNTPNLHVDMMGDSADDEMNRWWSGPESRNRTVSSPFREVPWQRSCFPMDLVDWISSWNHIFVLRNRYFRGFVDPRVRFHHETTRNTPPVM